MEEIEELVNDPGNHALLKEAAKEEEIEVKKLAKEAGLTHERTKDKVAGLEEKELIEMDRSEIPVVLKLKRKNLKKLNDRIKEFQEDKRHVLLDNLEKDKELLLEAKQKLSQKKDETSVVKKQKRFESQIESIQQVLEKIDDSETDDELFEAHALAHRVLKLTDKRDNDFHGFNPWRKLKASRKIEGILENEPEQDEPRRFFGNRWVKKSRLEQ